MYMQVNHGFSRRIWLPNFTKNSQKLKNDVRAGRQLTSFDARCIQTRRGSYGASQGCIDPTENYL